MKTTARTILNAALRLPKPDRVELATELLAHLEGASEAEVDAAWAAEIERRTREIDRGMVKPIPWSVRMRLPKPRRARHCGCRQDGSARCYADQANTKDADDTTGKKLYPSMEFHPFAERTRRVLG